MAYITGPMQLLGNNAPNVIYLAQDALGGPCMTLDNMSLQQPIIISYPQVNTLPAQENINQEIRDLPQLIYNDLNHSSFHQFDNLTLPDSDTIELESSNPNSMLPDLPQLIFNASFDTNISYANVQDDILPLAEKILDVVDDTFLKPMYPESFQEVVSEDQEKQNKKGGTMYRIAAKATCRHCGKLYFSQNVLRKHILRFHSSKHSCQKCTKQFDTSEKLILHEIDHWESGKQCPLSGSKACSIKFSRRAALTTHFSKYHVPDATNNNEIIAEKRQHLLEIANKKLKLTCKVCSKSFDKPSQLIRHNRIHSGEKPFKCQTCRVAFSQKNSLVLHKYTHSKVRPYKCPQCPSAFSQPGNLRTHLHKIHPKTTGNEMGKRCPHCPSVFQTKRCLKLHCTKFHENSGKQNKPVSSLADCLNTPKSKERLNILETALENSGVSVKEYLPRSNKTLSPPSGKHAKLNDRNQNQQHQIPNIELALPAAAPPLLNDVTQYRLTKIGKSESYLITTCAGSEMPEEIFSNTNISDPTPYFINDYDNKISVPGKFVFPSETPTFIIDNNQLNIFNTDLENIICLQNGANILDNLTNSSDTDYYITLDNGQVAVLKGQAIPNQQQAEETRNHINCDENKQIGLPKIQSPLKPAYEASTLQHSEVHAQKATKNKTSKASSRETTMGNKKILKCYRNPPLEHKCDLCPGSFAKNCDLIRHKRTHTGEKPFSCEICNRNFSLKSSLKVHQIIHEKTRKLAKKNLQRKSQLPICYLSH